MEKLKKDPRKVRLLGKGTGFEQAPDDDNFQLWGLNGLIYNDKKLDRLFIMDIIDEMPSILSGLWELQDTIDKINELDVPLVAPYKYEEIPKSEAFPIDEAFREFGQLYFNNTIAYMICYALLKGVDEIQLFGINQASSTEYFYEKGCVEYWLGIATGMGVKVSIHGKNSELLINKERYGGNRLYGYNVTYERLIKSNEKFGEAMVKKLLDPPSQKKVKFVGPEIKKGLRTSDILGIKEVWQKFANHPESKWIISVDDAYNIARLVIENKPKRILDLGTGIGVSAAVMKFIKPDAEVVSVEQSKKCVDISKVLIYSIIGKSVDVNYSEAEVFELEEVPNQKLSVYKEIPGGKWDMVVVDGPGEFLHNGEIALYPSGDVFRIIDNINPGGIVYVDGREKAISLISRFLTPFLEPLFRGTGFAVFKRTEQLYDKKLMVDELKIKLIEDKYFK